MDIISCRNLLIYLKPETQKRVISNFHFSLRSGGILLLGHSENISDNEGQFEVLDPKWRIYKRSGQQISRNNIDDYDFKKSVFINIFLLIKLTQATQRTIHIVKNLIIEL